MSDVRGTTTATGASGVSERRDQVGGGLLQVSAHATSRLARGVVAKGRQGHGGPGGSEVASPSDERRGEGRRRNLGLARARSSSRPEPRTLPRGPGGGSVAAALAMAGSAGGAASRVSRLPKQSRSGSGASPSIRSSTIPCRTGFSSSMFTTAGRRVSGHGCDGTSGRGTRGCGPFRWSPLECWVWPALRSSWGSRLAVGRPKASTFAGTKGIGSSRVRRSSGPDGSWPATTTGPPAA